MRSARSHGCRHTRCRAGRRARVTSARSRPDSTATGHCAANFRSASAAPATGLAASGSLTMSDSVPSKSKNTAGRRAARPSVRPRACNASGSWDIRRSPVRTVTSLRSATTVSAPLRAQRVAVPRPVDTDHQRESAVARGLRRRRRRSRRRRTGPAAPPVEAARRASTRTGNGRRFGGQSPSARCDEKTPVPTPTSCSCRTSVTVDSYGCRLPRRGVEQHRVVAARVDGDRLQLGTTNLLTRLVRAVRSASRWCRSARTGGVAARRWRAGGTNACGGLW